VTATAEEAVIAKETRVREEIVLRKEEEDRTQTVSDTVRRTEVEVEDDRASSLRIAPTPPQSGARNHSGGSGR
jgi:stress response protein YsnF